MVNKFNKVRSKRRVKRRSIKRSSRRMSRRRVKQSKKITQRRVKRSKKITQRRVKRSRRNSKRVVIGGSPIFSNKKPEQTPREKKVAHLKSLMNTNPSGPIPEDFSNPYEVREKPYLKDTAWLDDPNTNHWKEIKEAWDHSKTMNYGLEPEQMQDTHHLADVVTDAVTAQYEREQQALRGKVASDVEEVLKRSSSGYNRQKAEKYEMGQMKAASRSGEDGFQSRTYPTTEGIYEARRQTLRDKWRR